MFKFLHKVKCVFGCHEYVLDDGSTTVHHCKYCGNWMMKAKFYILDPSDVFEEKKE